MVKYIDIRPSFKSKFENWWDNHTSIGIGFICFIVSLIMFLLATYLPYSKRAYTKVPTEVLVVDKYRNTEGDYRIVYKISDKIAETHKHTVSFDEYNKVELNKIQKFNIKPACYKIFVWYWIFWIVFWAGIVIGFIFIITGLLDY